MNQIAVIDLEASGLHFDSYPIEVAVLINGKTRSWLIKPEPIWTYWCGTAQSMHGISREELEQNGLPVQTVAKELNEFLSEFDELLYSDASQWDEDWVDTLYLAAKETRNFHIGSIYDRLEADQIELFHQHKATLAESNLYQPHRAESDVRIIAEAYYRTLSAYED